MERKIVNQEEVKNMLANLFADELTNFELSKPKVQLLFSTSALDYVPGIVVKAAKGKEVKYLIYSPLQLSINILDEMPQTPEMELNKNYHLGEMNAQIVQEGNGLEIILSEDKTEGCPCRNKTQAEALIKAYVLMSGMQQDYFKIFGEDVYSKTVSGIKYWIKPHRGQNGFIVNGANSIVSYSKLMSR